ncbi:MAG: STAS domain-containing protein [Eubacteriales bacterium]
METKFDYNGDCLTITLEGRLDGISAPKLDAECKIIGEEVKKIIIEMKDLRFVASAGLRVILKLQKTMNKQGSMEIHNVKEEIMDVFELTGFAGILTFVKD